MRINRDKYLNELISKIHGTNDQIIWVLEDGKSCLLRNILRLSISLGVNEDLL